MIRWVDVIDGEKELGGTIDYVDIRLSPRQYVVLNEILANYKLRGDPRVNDVLKGFEFKYHKADDDSWMTPRDRVMQQALDDLGDKIVWVRVRYRNPGQQHERECVGTLLGWDPMQERNLRFSGRPVTNTFSIPLKYITEFERLPQGGHAYINKIVRGGD